MKVCFSCKNEVSIDGRPGRGDECPRCGADLKVCRNCRHYDRASYNECRESSAERVVEKERANFCDYFEFTDSDGGEESDGGGGKDLAMSKLKDIFKDG